MMEGGKGSGNGSILFEWHPKGFSPSQSKSEFAAPGWRDTFKWLKNNSRGGVKAGEGSESGAN